jgi:hypothetical protein
LWGSGVGVVAQQFVKVGFDGDAKGAVVGKEEW